jgi:tetratricopeptide (TPR) repeat protein
MLLFEPAVRVPLIIKAPNTAAAVRSDPASIIDIAPTVLAIAGLSSHGGALPGHDLLAAPQRDRESYGESQYPSVAGWTPLASLTQDRWKLIVADRPLLFDLKTDPQEAHDVSATRGSLVQAMSGRLDTIRKDATGGSSAGAANTVSPETAERLRSLGYVAPTAAPVARAGGIDPAGEMEAWAAFEDALTMINSGRIRDAVPSLAKIAASHPDAAIFQSTYARALAASGQKQLALERFRAAVKKWPADASLYHELAVVARDLNLAAEAARAEVAALVIDARDPMALNGKGLLLADAGKAAEAVRAFSDAVRLDPTNAVYLANLGNATRATGNLDGAANAYRRALDLSPSLGDALNGMGAILVQQKKAGEAVTYLEKAANDPAFVEAQLNLGIALQESGDLARAKAQYQKVVAASGHEQERAAARALLSQLERR